MTRRLVGGRRSAKRTHILLACIDNGDGEQRWICATARIVHSGQVGESADDVLREFLKRTERHALRPSDRLERVSEPMTHAQYTVRLHDLKRRFLKGEIDG